MSDTLPNEVREAMARAYADKAYQGGWDGHDAEEKAIVLQHFDAALSALEAAGWVCVPVSDQRFTVREVIDALITAGFTRVQSAPAALLTASNPKEKPDV